MLEHDHSVVVEFLDGQGLGNQLWNWASGLSIAKRSGRNLLVLNQENFKVYRIQVSRKTCNESYILEL